MNVYISIDGVLRNFINRFHYHYENAYINVDEVEDNFEYSVSDKIYNDDLGKYFKFQDKTQKEYFQYVEYPMELYGHSPLSYSNVANDFNKMVYENPHINFYLVGLNEYGKSKSATLFFLSKNGFMVNNVKFITEENIEKEWKNVSVWISDCQNILSKKPDKKDFILFNTQYNGYFEYEKRIEKLTDLVIKKRKICF